MKVNIEKYLKDKREHLDVEQPDDAMLWEGIRKGILLEKKPRTLNFWKVAAIFLAIFTISYIVYNEINREREREFTLSQINETLGEREREYQQMVLKKMEAANFREISSYTENDILPVLINELNELDTIYRDAMNDLKQHGYLEQIVHIIFDTYEKRMRILEQIIMESQKLEMYENDNQEISL
jgi:hypothetical protein